MIFFGASGHAKVVIEAWVAGGGKVSGIVDDDCSITSLLHYPVTCKYEKTDFDGKDLCISIGSNEVRKKISAELAASFRAVIHPNAVISPSARIGAGTVVMAGVVVNAVSAVGAHTILNTSSVVDHDCTVEDFAHVSPHATLCGGVHVGEGAHIGAGATIIQNIRIGKWAVIGAGSVIVKDVPDHAVVVGVPGEIIKYQKN